MYASYFKRPTNYLFKVASYRSDLECSFSKLETMDFISIIYNTLNVQYHAEGKYYPFFQFSTFVDFKNILPSEEVFSELSILYDVLQGLISFIVISEHSTPHSQFCGYLTSPRGFNCSLTFQTIIMLKYPIVSETLM